VSLVRVVSRTLDANGRVTFNQVTMVREPPPPGVLLVAIDPASGLYVWLKPHAEVDPHTQDQHPGYSRLLPAIDPLNPPPYLGDPVFVPAAIVDPADWQIITSAHTMALNRAVRALFGQ
jgi:hypothetical protein